MKYLIHLLLILTLGCVIFMGCSKKQADVQITLIPKALDSEFWQSLRAGAEEAAKEYPDVTLSVLAPTREINIDQQVNILEDQIIRRPSALVVAPCGTAEIIPVLEKAHTKDIPVILVDTDLDWPNKTCYVGSDSRLGGKSAGEFIIRSLSGEGKVAVITGIPGVQTNEDRVDGFLGAIQNASGIKLVAMQPANWERDLAMTVMENILTSHPDLDAVFAANDQMILGALEAIDAHHLDKAIITVGYDAGKEALKAVKNGRLTAVISQDPFGMGRKAIEMAVNIAKGEAISKRVETPTNLIDRSNIDMFLDE